MTEVTAPPVPLTAAVVAGRSWDRIGRWALVVAALVAAVFLGLELRDLLREVRFADVLTAVDRTPRDALIWAVVLTGLSFLALSGYDSSALRFVGARVDRGTVLLTSFIAYALGNTVGLGVLTGGAVRMRLYTAAGVEPARIAQAIAFNAGAFLLGMLAFGAIGLLWGATEVAGILDVPVFVLRGIALLMIAGVAALLVLCSRQRELLIGGRWRLHLPMPALAWQQLLISAADLVFAGAALWVLLPAGAVGLPTFMAFYAIALALAVVSHVPGGLGIFEAVILLACRGQAAPQDVLAALLVYRGVYYLLPLVIATGVLVLYELRSGVAAPVGRAAVHLSPTLMAALAMVAGLWLLISGVTPTSDEATQLLAMRVPLPIVEASHFVGSVCGLGLLLVARGLLHRLDVAWWIALGLSVLAGVLALPKGIALSEAGLLSVLALLLVMSRHQFDRRSSLVAQRLEPEWLLAVGAVIAGAVWVLFFAYQDVAYARQLWWQFEIDAQAPRSLRAITAVVLLASGYAMWELLRPPSGEMALPSAEDLERAARIVADAPNADACLALTGDKQLLFSDSGRSFIMFAKHRRTWVSLFDPVGDTNEWPELIWRFIEMAAAHNGRAAFYQVRPQALPLYLDAGLRAYKLGEHAHVPLADFSLKGSRRANLRHGVSRAEREGLSFEMLEPAAVREALPQLREVSDVWLKEQQAREKGFSLGSFDDDYLTRMPVAVVRHGADIVAFASIMTTTRDEEAAIDLMRHRPGAPAGTMDLLFAKVLLHFQQLGYARFGLGMAPMSGMVDHRLAPRWHRFGRLLFEHGRRFYNFPGLRSFKDKFDPTWEPRYLVSRGGATPVLVLSAVTALIGGGLKGVIAK